MSELLPTMPTTQWVLELRSLLKLREGSYDGLVWIRLEVSVIDLNIKLTRFYSFTLYPAYSRVSRYCVLSGGTQCHSLYFVTKASK